MNGIRNSAKAIIIRDGCLLLVQNKDEEGDWYTLPGGGQNHGETLREALQRECQEKISVSIQAAMKYAVSHQKHELWIGVCS